MIGSHDNVITISGRATNVPDGFGGVVEVWQGKWTGFAGIRRKGGGRGIDAGAAGLGSTYEFKIRRNPQIDFVKTDKIEWDGKTFTIVGIDTDEDRWQVITAAQTS
jgi:SPP1 family predicted phage head-tail adaptor